MRISRRFLAAGAALVLATGAGLAQDNPRPGGNRPGSGPGMMGFGSGPAGLLMNEAVRADVKVTEEQATKLKTWADENRGKMREKMQEAMKDVPREQMREKMAAVTAEMNKEVYKELGEVLKPEQVKRLKQIGVQAAGLAAFRQAEVQEALKLTADQKSKIQSISEEADKDRRELFTSAGFAPGQRPDPEKMQAVQKKVAAVSKEAFEEAEKSLTSEQKDAWKELTGEPFDTAKLAPGQPGQRRRGGDNPPPAPKDNN